MNTAKLINIQSTRAKQPFRAFGAAVLAALFVATTAYGQSATAQESGGGTSQPSVEVEEFITHTGPGGGSDVFIRQVSTLLQETGIVDEHIPVQNIVGGAAVRAMAHMASLAGSTDTVALMTPTWLTTPLTTSVAPVTAEDLTPIVRLITEPTLLAVRSDSEIGSLQEFIDNAKKNPGGLVWVAGSVTSVDALSSAVLQEVTGAEWSYLSHASGGERVAALLRGDADVMSGSPSDFAQLAEAGKVRVLAVIGDTPTKVFPDAPTLDEAGFSGANVPQQFRGIIGPPEMPEEAVAAYTDMFRALTKTDAWAEFMTKMGVNSGFMPPDEYRKFLSERTESIRTQLEGLGLLANEAE